MKTFYSKSKLFLILLTAISLTATRASAQVGTQFFPVGGANWSTDVFTELNFTGTQASNIIATTFNGLTNPAANTNDFTGLKLTFGAYVSSDVDQNTIVVLGSDANWGGQGIVIEIDKDEIRGLRNFQYTDFSNPIVSFTASAEAAYKANVRQNQYNTFIIDVSATGVITVNVNGIAYATPYPADITVLQAPDNRFAVFSGYTGFKIKNLKAEKAGVTREYFISNFSTKYAETVTDWSIDANNELSFTGNIPFNNPAIVETTFGGLTEPTPTTNDFTGLKLTFNAFISSGFENTSVVLSSNGLWGTGNKGTLIAFNKNEATGSVNFGAATTLSTNALAYQAIVLPGAYNSFIIDVAADSKITITVNGYVLPTVFQGSTLTASLPNPRYALFATDFKPFKLKNVVAVKGGVTKSYFANVLPVTLISFNATKKANGSQLNWETASETNNAHFIVYKSVDGSNFAEITKVTAKNQASKYQYIDAAPVSGDNYYKLVQVDLNGTTTDLGVKVVNFDLQTENVISIYPKPATGSINLSFARTFEDAITVKLFDLSGRELQNVTIPVQNAPVNYVLNFNSKIAPGVYIINVTSGAFTHSERLLVN